MDIVKLLVDSNMPANIFENRAAYLQAIKEGVSGKFVEQGIKELDERQLFISVLNTDAPNLNRYYHKPVLNKTDTEGVLDTIKLMKYAVEVFGDYAKAKTWMHDANPSLRSNCPIDLCDTFEGRKLVTETLRKIDFGDFS